MKPFRNIEDRHGLDQSRLPPAPDADTDEHDVPLARDAPRRGLFGPFGAVVVVAAIVILAALYFNGNLDRPLYSIGLNYHECGRNGLGATFCGSELDQYREHVQDVQQSLQTTENEAKQQEETIQREAREQEQKASREEEALQRQSELESEAP